MLSAAAELAEFMTQAKVDYLMPLVVEAVGADPLQQLREVDHLQAFYVEATPADTSVIWMVTPRLLTRLELNTRSEAMTVHIPLIRVRRVQADKLGGVQRTIIEFDADRTTVLEVDSFTRFVPSTYTLELPSANANVGRLIEFTRKLAQALP